MAETTVYRFQVEGMHCGSCGMLIDEAVEELGGVVRSETRFKTGLTTVELDPRRCNPDAVVATITDVGYPARPQSL